MSADTEYDEDFTGISQRNATRGAQIIQVESPAKHVVPLCIASLILSVAALVYAYHVDSIARDAKTQAWLAERRLMDMEAYAMLNGWKIPSDDTHGPTGNFERMKPSSAKE